jgi:hypothetical protein
MFRSLSRNTLRGSRKFWKGFIAKDGKKKI